MVTYRFEMPLQTVASLKSRITEYARSLEKKDRATLSSWLDREQDVVFNAMERYFREENEALYNQAVRVVSICKKLQKLTDLRKVNPDDMIEKLSEHVNAQTERCFKIEGEVEQLLKQATELKARVAELGELVTHPNARMRDANRKYDELMEMAGRESNPFVKTQMIRSAGLIVASANGINGGVDDEHLTEEHYDAVVAVNTPTIDDAVKYRGHKNTRLCI